MPWDPRRYHQFQKERFAPFEDLLRLIKARSGLRVIDLGCGTGELNVFEKIYPHVLEDADAMVAWMQGTALVPYFDRLPKELHERFLRSYRERLRRRFPDRPVFYGFNRTLIAATRVQ